jgi:general secretion pathway protein D
MKTSFLRRLISGLALGIWTTVACLSAEPPPDAPPPAENPAQPTDQQNDPAPPPDQPMPPADAPVPNETPPADEAPPSDSPAPVPAEQADPPADQADPPRNPAVAPLTRVPTKTPEGNNSADSPTATAVLPDGVKGLRLNFRGAPLELVLNYLSEAAGFIIIPETDIKGKVDVWSNQPLTKDEAVEVLNTVLNKNGYTALRNGRTLKIVSKEDARKQDLPVKSGSDPVGIPKNDDIVTQIIPVRFVNAVQLSRDLTPLMPPEATVVANEGGNAIVITDSQIHIRRVAEIIRALDTSIASVSAVRVFPLSFADAKAVATVIRDLFLDTTQRGGGGAGNNQMQQFFRGMRGGNMPGAPGGAQAGGSTGSGGGRVTTPRVVAAADERSNSVVVSAPDDQMPMIEELIKQIDTNVEDVTELRVFRLRFADPQETAELLTSLFPDTTTQQGSRAQVRFGGGPFGGGRMGMAATGDQSSRMLKQSRVIAVPDLRTSSVVVSAARDLLSQIAQMIEQLDSDPAKKQKVFVYSVENTDPAEVEEILRGLFESQNSRSSRTTTRNSSSQVGNQLNNRATTRQQNQRNTSNSGMGNSFSGSTGRTGQ